MNIFRRILISGDIITPFLQIASRDYVNMTCHRDWYQHAKMISWQTKWRMKHPTFMPWGSSCIFQLHKDDVDNFMSVMEQYGWSASKDRPFQTGQGLNDAHQ